jgi:hypothetical protein
MMKQSSLVVPLLLLAACGSAPPEPEAVTAPAVVAVAPAPAPEPKPAADDVQFLTEYPTSADYDDLGTTSFTFFRKGYRTPSVPDVLVELKTRVREAGGNAFIVVGQQPDRDDKRILRVSAEILRVK